MNQILTLSGRPQTFDQLIGQKHMVDLIRTRYKSGRLPPALMFVGESGAGKTTVARIIATSLQCKHQETFGNPCEACRRNRAKFDIIEINASESSSGTEVEQIIVGANYTPKPPSRKRVYMFDEAQKLKGAAQSVLLKYFEDSPSSTVWIICTTEPGKILRTLRRRCFTYTIPNLGMKGVASLVERTIKQAGQKKDAEPLTEALLEAGITSPGFVVLATEKYLDGETAEKASQVGLDSSLDTLRICRAVVKGDWDTVKQQLFAANPEDSRAVRGAVSGYLKSILLGSDIGSAAKRAADAIVELTKINTYEDGLQLSATIAALYRLCMLFRH